MAVEVWTVLGWVLSPVCAALAGALLGYARSARRADRAMADGMRALLRQQLVDYHRLYVASGGPCPVSIKEQATEVYEAYHALGGNGTGTRLHEEIMAAHVG